MSGLTRPGRPAQTRTVGAYPLEKVVASKMYLSSVLHRMQRHSDVMSLLRVIRLAKIETFWFLVMVARTTEL